MAQLTQSALAAMIDHTLLKADASKEEIETLCREAIRHRFASVCVNPYRVNLAANVLHGSNIPVCTVIGFPLGANATPVKAMEVIKALADGASELDVVLSVGALKDNNLGDVEGDLRAVMKAAQGRLVKVILETALLTEAEIVTACEISEKCGAAFVKTSTGFAKSGAKVSHVKLMRQTVGERLGIKASGGIRDKETLLEMVEAGATRIGTSSGVGILELGGATGDY